MRGCLRRSTPPAVAALLLLTAALAAAPAVAMPKPPPMPPMPGGASASGPALPRTTGPQNALPGAAAPQRTPPGAAVPQPATVWKKYIARSPSSGKIERFWVGHRAGLKPDGRYPSIYFLPGLLDTDDDWKNALDPHLAGYDVVAVCPSVGGAAWFMNSPAQPWCRWGDFLTDDLRRFVESHYPVAPEKGQRGIAGISAGAHGAFLNAVQRPDLYATVSLLSGAMDLRVYAGNFGLDWWIGPRGPETAKLYADRAGLVLAGRLVEPPPGGSPPMALFLDAADKDGALTQMETLRRAFDARGIACKWFVGQGGHNWAYWNTRADDHLAWQMNEFDRNRRDNRYAEKPTPKGGDLEVLTALPAVEPAPETLARLRAPWTDAPGLRPVAVTGVPTPAAPLAKADPKFKEVRGKAALPVSGHQPGVHVFRITVRLTVPLPQAGTVGLRAVLTTRRGAGLTAFPITLAVPAGESQRPVDLRGRLAVELKSPDPLRGGLVAAFQAMDADGRPAGDPVIGRVPPGSMAIERWPLGPQVLTEWALTLPGDKAIPLAAVQEIRIEEEP